MRCFWDIRLQKMSWPWNPGQSSLKVIGTDTDRFATYDFLLTFHSNQSYRFRDKRRFQSNIAKFPHPAYFASPLKGFPLELGTGAGSQETRMMWLPGRERSLTISSAVWIQYTNMIYGQKDRRTDSGRQQRPRLRIPSRGETVGNSGQLVTVRRRQQMLCV